jgi:hypothetical protein
MVLPASEVGDNEAKPGVADGATKAVHAEPPPPAIERTVASNTTDWDGEPLIIDRDLLPVLLLVVCVMFIELYPKQ